MSVNVIRFLTVRSSPSNDGDACEAGQIVATWDPHTHPIITEVAGTRTFSDFVDGMTRQTADR